MGHIEFIIEEFSAEEALKNLLPKILSDGVSYKIHSHFGKTHLLRNLSGRLKAYRKWIPADWKIVILIDEDRQDCKAIKTNLEHIAIDAGFITKSSSQGQSFQVLNRIAVEELEAWFFGDVNALVIAYPRVSANLNKKAGFRNPDAIRGGTWERLEKVLQEVDYFPAGMNKVEVARNISKHMEPDCNQSKSFQVFVSGVKALVR